MTDQEGANPTEEKLQPSIVEDPTNDLHDFVDNTPAIVKTVKGEDLHIPDPVWGQDLLITEAIIEVVKQIVNTNSFMTLMKQAQDTGTFDLSPTLIVGIIAEGCTGVPRQLTKICAAVVDKSEDFVMKNLNMDTVFSIIVPSLKARVDKIVSVLADLLKK